MLSSLPLSDLFILQLIVSDLGIVRNIVCNVTPPVLPTWMKYIRGFVGNIIVLSFFARSNVSSSPTIALEELVPFVVTSKAVLSKENGTFFSCSDENFTEKTVTKDRTPRMVVTLKMPTCRFVSMVLMEN